MKAIILLALLASSLVLADQVRYSNIAYTTMPTHGGTSCQSRDTFELRSLYFAIPDNLFSIPIDGLSANDIISARLNAEFHDCMNPTEFQVSYLLSPYQSTMYPGFGADDGFDYRCPVNEVPMYPIRNYLDADFDAQCKSNGVDVTQALKDAVAAGRTQFAATISYKGGSRCRLNAPVTPKPDAVTCYTSLDTRKIFLDIKTQSQATQPASAPTNSCTQKVVFAKNDLITGSSPGGTSCSHNIEYDFTGNSRGGFYIGFDISSTAVTPAKVEIYVRGRNCVNTDKLSLTISTLQDPMATITNQGGINAQCPFYNNQDTTRLNMEDDCISTPVDVTAAYNAAKAAGNSQLVLSMFSSIDQTQSNPNFCNHFVTPGVEPHFNDNSNCGVTFYNSGNYRNDYLLAITPSTCTATTQAPQPSAPPTTTAPPNYGYCWTCPAGYIHWFDVPGMEKSADACACVPVSNATPEPCWTCPAGHVHWYDVPGMTQPADRCACVPTPSAPEPCWTCPAGHVHWYDIEGMAEPEDKCACVPEQCWTCAAGWIHWYDAGMTTAPGGDRCACVPQQRRLSSFVKKLEK